MTLPAAITPRPTLQLAHHRTHEGNHYAVHKITTGIMIANPKYFLIEPPHADPIPSNTSEIHLIFEVTSYDTGFKLEMFEDANIAILGTELTAQNYNRIRNQVSLTHIYEDPTINSEGTKIFEDMAGSTITGGNAGEIDRDEDEFILKTGSDYLFKITPLVDNLTTATEFNWYDNRPSIPFA